MPAEYDSAEEYDEQDSLDYDSGEDYENGEDMDDDEPRNSKPVDEEDSGSDFSETLAGEEEGTLVDLAEALAAAPSKHDDYSFSGSADWLPKQPGLVIDGYGEVALPVVDKEKADAIAAVCEQAPFGRGFDTLVDTKVRNSLQVSPDKVKLTNPAWRAGIQKAANLIAEKLGVTGVPITLHLYKLLFYQEGGHFAKHRDTEKEPTMFATMVVQLPSCHEGGHLHVFRANDPEPIIHDFGDAAGTKADQAHFAVHYADSEHAVTPITSGYRMALVYSICWPTDNPRTAPVGTLGEDTEDLVECFQEVSNEHRLFHYMLEHAYTERSMTGLGAAALKGLDRSRINTLRAVNAVLDPKDQYDFYFGAVERQTVYASEGSGYGHIYRDAEWVVLDPADTTLVGSLLDVHGKEIKSGRHLTPEEHTILNPDKLSTGELWHGQRTTYYEGYLGNVGPQRTTVYRKCFCLAVPRALGDLGVEEPKAVYKKLMSTSPTLEQLDDFLTRFAMLQGANAEWSSSPLTTFAPSCSPWSSITQPIARSLFAAFASSPRSPPSTTPWARWSR